MILKINPTNHPSNSHRCETSSPIYIFDLHITFLLRDNLLSSPHSSPSASFVFSPTYLFWKGGWKLSYSLNSSARIRKKELFQEFVRDSKIWTERNFKNHPFYGPKIVIRITENILHDISTKAKSYETSSPRWWKTRACTARKICGNRL